MAAAVRPPCLQLVIWYGYRYGLGSGQEVHLRTASARFGLSEVTEGSARPGTILPESGDVEMVAGSVKGDEAAVMDDGVGAGDGARSGVGELDSGPPVHMQDVGNEAGQSDARLAARGAAPPRRSPARATRVDDAPGGLQDVAAAVSARASARPGVGHDVVVGRDILGPTSQNDGGDGDDVQHPGGHRGDKITLPTSSGSRGGQKQQHRNQKKRAARRARAASLL